MTLNGLPMLMKLAGRPVILAGEGEAADAKRRLLERAGAMVVPADHPDARLAIVAIDDADQAMAVIATLRARGLLINAVDRPDQCDFTLPAIVDRSPVLIAISTGGASAGLAAALRQRLEAMIPADLGGLADALNAARAVLKGRLPDGGERRRALAAALAAGGPIDPLAAGSADRVPGWAAGGMARPAARLVRLLLASPDPDDLTLGQARLLASADRVTHRPDVPPAILDRARADAARIATPAPPDESPDGLWIDVEMRT
jgi:uroporphyrin-III C-methyltransferase/precorrin-2 dehydrogenase/sirohydrochlorin ferrochelatase